MKICAVFSVVVALAMGSPVPLNSRQCPCPAAARSLLSNLSHIMEKEGKMKHQDLFAGFNCTDLEAQMIPHTLTASVCQPSAADNTSCSDRRNSSFSETECLRNIRGDLRYYDLLLNSYQPRPSDLNPVLNATEQLMRCLKASGDGGADAQFPRWLVWSGSSFDDRLSLCKILKGFHVRAITMNRALAYIASGDHRK